MSTKKPGEQPPDLYDDGDTEHQEGSSNVKSEPARRDGDNILPPPGKPDGNRSGVPLKDKHRP